MCLCVSLSLSRYQGCRLQSTYTAERRHFYCIILKGKRPAANVANKPPQAAPTPKPRWPESS